MDGSIRDAIRRCVAEEWSETPNRAVVLHYARAFLGELDPAAIEEGFARVLAATQNPRYLALTTQLATEAHVGVGDFDAARAHLQRAADSVLVDLEWLDRCPLLARLRELPEFATARRRVRARADAIWTF